MNNHGKRSQEPEQPHQVRKRQYKRLASLSHDAHCFRVRRVEELAALSERTMISQPKEIAYFSKSSNGAVRFDRSNLIGVDLLDGIATYVSKDDAHPLAHPAPLAPFLSAFEHFQGNNKNARQPDFLTYRNNLNKIMGTPYNSSNEWTFLAEKRGECVYLDVQRTHQEMENNRNAHENQRRGAYAGRRFELYSTHSNPTTGKVSEATDANANSKRSVDEEEEFCGVFALTLGGKRLVVAAEIDCYDATTDQKEYLELKTFRVLKNDKDRFVFERFKLLAFWIQSYLIGIPRIVCGFRTDQFQIAKLQTFQTTAIPDFCRKYWNPQVCLNFTKTLLEWLADHTREGQIYQVSYRPRDHVVEMINVRRESFLPQSWRVEQSQGRENESNVQ